jgi:hypothetical protein
LFVSLIYESFILISTNNLGKERNYFGKERIFMRKISIIILMMATVVSLYGCTKSEVEKKPITIEDTEKSDIINVNNEDDDMSVKVDSDTSESENDERVTEHIIEVEGTKETILRKTYQSTNGYQITYDVERFKYTNLDGIDQFITENPDPELYPYVYLNISKIENTSSKDEMDKIKKALSKGYEQVEELENTTIGIDYKAIGLKAKSGTDWNSSIREYYIVESGNSNYVIEMQYFVEAEEGFGTRMHDMLNTFTIK